MYLFSVHCFCGFDSTGSCFLAFDFSGITHGRAKGGWQLWVPETETEFTLVLLFIDYCIIFHRNHCPPAFAHPCIEPALRSLLAVLDLVNYQTPVADLRSSQAVLVSWPSFSCYMRVPAVLFPGLFRLNACFFQNRITWVSPLLSQMHAVHLPWPP